jgi:tetratricopeptide (TPR) repeat protein
MHDGESSWRARAVNGELEAGSWLEDRFRIIGLLGKGGMGVVYRAHDPTAKREVALKVVAKALNARQLERFRREGELTAKLHHPGIVGIHEAGQVAGIPFLSYELVEGGRSLEDAFAAPSATAAQRVEWVAQTAEALGHAHERGVIHRDVKPANVLLDQTDQARVADFGLALGQGATRMTQTGAMLGTPTHASPEQISGTRELGPQTDVWSLGVLLYEALTGKLPFVADSLVELAGTICAGNPRPPRSVVPSVDRGLEAVCLQALEVEAERRYTDAGAFARDLRRAQRGESVSASTAGQRWVRDLRNSTKARVAMGLLLLSAISGGLVAALWTRAPSRQPGSESPVDPAAAGEALLAEGRYAEAAEVLRQLPTGAPRPARYLRAEAYLLAERLEEAEAECHALIGELPRDRRVARLLGRVHLAAGDLEGVEAVLARRQTVGGGLWVPLLEAQLLAARGTDGLPSLRLAAKDTANSETLVRQHDRADVLSAYLLLGEVREAAAQVKDWPSPGEPEPRYARLRSLVAVLLDPGLDPAPLRAAPPAVKRAALGWLLAEGERDTMLRLRPRSAPVAADWVESDFPLEGWTARARGSLGLLLSVSPTSPHAVRAHVLLWRLARAQGEDGTAHLTAATGLDAADPQVRLAGAEEALDAGDPARSLALLDDTPVLSGFRAELCRGLALLAQDRHAAAVAPLRQAFEPRRRDDVAGDALALALRGSGEVEAAAEVAQRVARLRGSEKEEATRLYSLARDVMKEESASKRREVMGEALELYPHLAQARFWLAKLQGRSGLAKDALRGMILTSAEQMYLHAREATTVMREMCASGLTYAFGGESASSLQELLEELTEEDRPEDALVRAFVLAARVEYEGAGEASLLRGLRELTEILRDRPGEVLAWLLRGYLHMRRGNLIQARRDLTIAREATPEAAWFYLGLLRATEGASAASVLDALGRGRSHGHPGIPLDQLSVYPELAPYLRSERFRQTLLANGWR